MPAKLPTPAPPRPIPETPRAQAVHRLAYELGFDLVGIAPAEPTDYTRHVRDWIGAGKHGDMAYLKDQLEDRLDPRKLVPGARSIICVAVEYGGQKAEGRGAKDEENSVFPPSALCPPLSVFAPPPSAFCPPSPSSGRIARYAHDDDYHRTLKKRLHTMADGLRVRWPDHEYRSAVDTAPILEREHAARAGIGWVGKNTLLIHPDIGSYFFLGEIVTTLAIQPSIEAGMEGIANHCGTCTRCIDACPTHCITPYSIDASRCVSYLTLEHRGPIAPELHEPMGDWIAGCDVCQEVCPFNEDEGGGRKAEGGKSSKPASSFTPPPSAFRPPSLPLLDLLHWDAPARQRAFERSALKRLKLDQLKRNALIAAGNSLARHNDAALRARIEQLAHDPAEPELIRTTANQVLTQLNNPKAQP